MAQGRMITTLTALGLVLAAGAAAQQQPLTEQQAASGQFRVQDQGTAIKPQTQAHFDAAEKAAGTDFTGGLLLCNSARPAALKHQMPKAAELSGAAALNGKPPEAAKVFDNLYYLGVAGVTAWAVNTPQGIILIDALNNKKDIIDTVEPGLRKFGLDPAQIKYVVVTHGHGDHYGGTAYLAQKYHARIMMSDSDWTLAPTTLDKPEFDAPAPRDMVIKDGQKLTLGGETLTLYITPGHTLGTVSVLIPVTDRGAKHVVALWGGTGFNFPHNPARFQIYAQSAQRFMSMAMAAGADVPLSNHPENDIAIRKTVALKNRGPNDPNPFVMGQDAVRRYFTVYAECAKAYGVQMAH
jgi:metallo-beta-lactamase class B